MKTSILPKTSLYFYPLMNLIPLTLPSALMGTGPPQGAREYGYPRARLRGLLQSERFLKPLFHFHKITVDGTT